MHVRSAAFIAALIALIAVPLGAVEGTVIVNGSPVVRVPASNDLGIAPAASFRYDRLTGVDGELGFIAGLRRRFGFLGREDRALIVGLAATGEMGYNTSGYALGLGGHFHTLMLLPSEAAARLQYVRLFGHHHHDIIQDRGRYDGLRLTVNALSPIFIPALSLTYLRDLDHPGNHAITFGIGLGF